MGGHHIGNKASNLLLFLCFVGKRKGKESAREEEKKGEGCMERKVEKPRKKKIEFYFIFSKYVLFFPFFCHYFFIILFFVFHFPVR